jgi:hypothetical protein
MSKVISFTNYILVYLSPFSFTSGKPVLKRRSFDTEQEAKLFVKELDIDTSSYYIIKNDFDEDADVVMRNKSSTMKIRNKKKQSKQTKQTKKKVAKDKKSKKSKKSKKNKKVVKKNTLSRKNMKKLRETIEKLRKCKCDCRPSKKSASK